MTTDYNSERLRIEEKRIDIDERLRLMELELRNKEAELSFKQRELDRRHWLKHPIVAATVIASLSLISAIAAGLYLISNHFYVSYPRVSSGFSSSDWSGSTSSGVIGTRPDLTDDSGGSFATSDLGVKRPPEKQLNNSYEVSLGFQIESFSIFSKNPGATLDDLFKAIKDGAEAGKEAVSLADKVLVFYQSLRNSLPKDEGSAEQIVLLDQNISFDLDKIVLDYKATSSLGNVISYLKSEAGKAENILIEGHTDAIGSTQYNKDLSQRRAEAVQKFLIDSGIESSRIQTFGYGEGYAWLPFLPNHDDNRRVRIVSCKAQGAGPSRCQTDK